MRRQTELSERYATDNGLELVSDFQLHDIGVSAYKGANVRKGALGVFLQAVQNGEVPSGSFLLVESLDRLSRQNINNSVALFLQITQSGVNIVTLADNQIYRAGKTDFAQLIYSIVVMARANEESETKSSRNSAAWENKRRMANQRVLTKICPAWLKVNDDSTGFEIVPERARTVARIFKAAASGQGSGIITRILNTDSVPVFGRSNGWNESYVTKILKSRAVLGEFQPHVMINGKRVPEGPAIEGYFPKVIDEKMFLKVQAGRRERTLSGGGRRGPIQRNLFTHIVKCGYCGSPMRFVNKGNGPKGGKYLRCSASVRGMDCVATSWRYDDFEKSFFSFVREIDLRAIVEDSFKRSEIAAMHEEIAILRQKAEYSETERSKVYELLINSTGNSAVFLKNRLDQLSDDIATISKEVAKIEERQRQDSFEAAVEASTKDQLAALNSLTNSVDLKDRLNVASKLKNLVARVDIAVEGKQPKFYKIKKQVEEMVEDPKERQGLINSLKDSYLHGPHSNPYFTLVFHDGSSRTVVPDLNDPTSLHWETDHNHKGVVVTDSEGAQIAMFKSPRENLSEDED